MFDVAALMEDSETKTAALEKVNELEDELGHVSLLIVVDCIIKLFCDDFFHLLF